MSQNVQRSLALGLLILALSMFAGATVVPLLGVYLDGEVELDLAQGRHQKLANRRKDASLLRKEFGSAMIDMAGSGPLTATSYDEAALMAEQHIRAILDRRQSPLNKWSVLPGGEKAGLRTVQAELAFVLPSSDLLSTLSVLENSRPAVFFDRIVIRKQSLSTGPEGTRTAEQTEVSGTIHLLVVTHDNLTRQRS